MGTRYVHAMTISLQPSILYWEIKTSISEPFRGIIKSWYPDRHPCYLRLGQWLIFHCLKKCYLSLPAYLPEYWLYSRHHHFETLSKLSFWLFLKTYKNGMINNDVTVWISFSASNKSFLAVLSRLSALECLEEKNVSYHSGIFGGFVPFESWCRVSRSSWETLAAITTPGPNHKKWLISFVYTFYGLEETRTTRPCRIFAVSVILLSLIAFFFRTSIQSPGFTAIELISKEFFVVSLSLRRELLPKRKINKANDKIPKYKINLISVFSISALMRTFLSSTLLTLPWSIEKEGIIRELERIKLLFDMEITAGGMRTIFNQNRRTGNNASPSRVSAWSIFSRMVARYSETIFPVKRNDNIRVKRFVSLNGSPTLNNFMARETAVVVIFCLLLVIADLLAVSSQFIPLPFRLNWVAYKRHKHTNLW